MKPGDIIISSMYKTPTHRHVQVVGHRDVQLEFARNPMKDVSFIAVDYLTSLGFEVNPAHRMNDDEYHEYRNKTISMNATAFFDFSAMNGVADAFDASGGTSPSVMALVFNTVARVSAAWISGLMLRDKKTTITFTGDHLLHRAGEVYDGGWIGVLPDESTAFVMINAYFVMT